MRYVCNYSVWVIANNFSGHVGLVPNPVDVCLRDSITGDSLGLYKVHFYYVSVFSVRSSRFEIYVEQKAIVGFSRTHGIAVRYRTHYVKAVPGFWWSVGSG